jgi:hypothetical protein
MTGMLQHASVSKEHRTLMGMVDATPVKAERRAPAKVASVAKAARVVGSDVEWQEF